MAYTGNEWVKDLIIFDGTAKRNELDTSVIWAGGKVYKLIDARHRVLTRDRSYFDFPDSCPFEKSSDFWGITIYKTADVSYFIFEVA